MGPSTRLRFKGEFDYNQLYVVMKDFFTSRQYDFYETRYKDKGNEYEVEWMCERSYDETHLIRFNIAYHAWDVERINVRRAGKLETKIRARIEINIVGSLDKHYKTYNNTAIFNDKDRFDGFLKKLYDKVTHRSDDEYWEEEIIVELLVELSSEIKEHLHMNAI